MSMVVRWQDGMTENLSPDRAVEDVSALPGSLDAGAQAVREKVRLDRFSLRAERSRERRWTAMLDRFHELRGLREFGGLWRGYYHAPFLRNCRVPCHYTGVWFDHFVRGSCEAFKAHKGPKRLTIQPGQQGTHGAHADLDMTAEHLRWFDRWLRGRGSGGMDEPPVRLFVMGAEEWRGFSDWPPPEARTRRLALSAGGRLSAAGAARPFRSVLRHDPADPVPWCWIEHLGPLEKRSAVWTTAPLERPLAVIGEPRLRLRVRSSSTDGHLHVRIADVAPASEGGKSRQVAEGRLRLAHREGHDRVAPMPAGEAVPVEIELWPVANVFKAGHRLRLIVTASDSPTFEVYPEKCELVLSGAKGSPAEIELPVVG
jgi:hypothetical protein